MTSVVLLGSIIHTLFGLVLFFTALFLIMLVLIQRGRGGGLSGALGGMGGQSAFGSKAGDTFTFITIIVATFWILLCIAGVAFMKHAGSDSPFDATPTDEAAPANPDESAPPAEGEPANEAGPTDSAVSPPADTAPAEETAPATTTTPNPPPEEGD